MIDALEPGTHLSAVHEFSDESERRSQIEIEGLARRSEPQTFAPIADQSAEQNPAIKPDNFSPSVAISSVRCDILAREKDRFLVEADINIDSPLPYQLYPLATIFEGRNPGSLSLPQTHKAHLATRTVLHLDVPTFVGTLPFPPGEAEDKVRLIFLTLKEEHPAEE